MTNRRFTQLVLLLFTQQCLSAAAVVCLALASLRIYMREQRGRNIGQLSRSSEAHETFVVLYRDNQKNNINRCTQSKEIDNFIKVYYYCVIDVLLLLS